MENKKIVILIAPAGGAKSYRITISKEMAWLAAVGLGLMVIALVTSLAMYGKVAVEAGRAKSIETENKRLVAQTQRVEALEAELSRLKSFESRMLALLGVEPVSAEMENPAEPQAYESESDSVVSPSGGFLWPVIGSISRGYILDESAGTPHLGIDIAGETGAQVRAARAGTVKYAGPDEVFGNMVLIDHGGGITTLYGHNSGLNVKEGDVVTAGQVIARLGSTGRSSAPHLHFEIKEGESSVDPLKYLQRMR